MWPYPPPPRETRSCTEGELALVQKRERGVLRRLYVAVSRAGQPALLFLDTGNARSMLHASQDDGTSESILIGCRSFELPLLRHRAEAPFEGLEVIGTLGTDYFRDDVFEIDLARNALRRAPAADTATWHSIPLEVIQGIAIVRGHVGGRDLRLMLDTGTDDLLLLGAAEGLSVTTTDVSNNTLTLVYREEWFAFPGAAPRLVPAWHTLSHPAFEEHVEQLGGNVDGIVGLTTLEHHRIQLDYARQEMRLAD